MDDLSEKLSSILSDPQAMKEVAALASQLGIEQPGVHKEQAHAQHANVQAAPDQHARMQSVSQPDEAAMLSGLLPMLGTLRQDDDTVRLLEAMRPFLSEERQLKLDKAKRLIKVMKLMPLLKDLPLFDL